MKIQFAGEVKRFKTFASPPVVDDVKIHKITNLGHEDGDPLWEVDATVSFEDGTQERIFFDYVRFSHYNALRNPNTPARRFEIWCKINDDDPYYDDNGELR